MFCGPAVLSKSLKQMSNKYSNPKGTRFFFGKGAPLSRPRRTGRHTNPIPEMQRTSNLWIYLCFRRRCFEGVLLGRSLPLLQAVYILSRAVPLDRCNELGYAGRSRLAGEG